MRALIVAVLLTLVTPSAFSQEISGMSCASVIANAENGGMESHLAVATYFYGQFMGKPCVEVDYDRAYALAQKHNVSFEPFEKVLRVRAEEGHPTSVSALKRLGL